MNLALGRGMYSPLPKHRPGEGPSKSLTAAAIELPPLPPAVTPSRASKAIPGTTKHKPLPRDDSPMNQLLKKTRSASSLSDVRSPVRAAKYQPSTIAWDDSDSDGDEIEGMAKTITQTDGIVGAKGYLFNVTPAFYGACVTTALVDEALVVCTHGLTRRVCLVSRDPGTAIGGAELRDESNGWTRFSSPGQWSGWAHVPACAGVYHVARSTCFLPGTCEVDVISPIHVLRRQPPKLLHNADDQCAVVCHTGGSAVG